MHTVGPISTAILLIGIGGTSYLLAVTWSADTSCRLLVYENSNDDINMKCYRCHLSSVRPYINKIQYNLSMVHYEHDVNPQKLVNLKQMIIQTEHEVIIVMKMLKQM